MSETGSKSSVEAGEGYGSLADLVGYQSGAVVSRTLLKTKAGNLTIFAFDKGQGLSEHTTPNEALLWLLEGRLKVEIQGQSYTLDSGDFIRLPAQIPHALEALEKMKMGLVIFQNE
ncbi:MAG: cupin domain-containing protein [Anaerolineales bacterium]|nr:MAG: cupin domain-containing protein [Anaerolineales bacterium]